MIRKATEKDLEQLFNIYQKISLKRDLLEDLAYQTKIQKDGFLLGLEDKEEFKKLITEAFCFLIAEEGGNIQGFIIADHREKFIDDNYKTWFNQESKDLYYNSPSSMTLSIVGIDPGLASKGIASSLLAELEKELHKKQIKYLFSIVTLSPITNCPSIVFHSRNKFTRIAMGKPRTLFGLENYSACLLFKPLG